MTHKLDAYLLVVAILYDRGELERAYMINHEVLSELGESIPDHIEDMKEITKSTSLMLQDLSEDTLLEMKHMERKEQYILQFYSNISVVAFFNHTAVLPYFNCRMVELTMRHGTLRVSSCRHLAYKIDHHVSCSCLLLCMCVGFCKYSLLGQSRACLCCQDAEKIHPNDLFLNVIFLCPCKGFVQYAAM